MNNQKKQLEMLSTEREFQDLDDDTLKNVSGGTLPKPVLQKSNSAPARLEPGAGEPLSLTSSPTVDTIANHALQEVRIHPYPPQVTFGADHDHIIVDGITRVFH